jgi:hypothetical protein
MSQSGLVVISGEWEILVPEATVKQGTAAIDKYVQHEKDRLSKKAESDTDDDTAWERWTL